MSAADLAPVTPQVLRIAANVAAQFPALDAAAAAEAALFFARRFVVEAGDDCDDGDATDAVFDRVADWLADNRERAALQAAYDADADQAYAPGHNSREVSR